MNYESCVDPYSRQVQHLQHMLDLYKDGFPEIADYSVYHIQGVLWLKHQRHKVISQDRRLGEFSQALSEITKMTELLMRVDRLAPPPMFIEMQTLSDETLKRFWELVRIPNE